MEVLFHVFYYYWGNENQLLYRGLHYIEVRYIEVLLYGIKCMLFNNKLIVITKGKSSFTAPSFNKLYENVIHKIVIHLQEMGYITEACQLYSENNFGLPVNLMKFFLKKNLQIFCHLRLTYSPLFYCLAYTSLLPVTSITNSSFHFQQGRR